MHGDGGPRLGLGTVAHDDVLGDQLGHLDAVLDGDRGRLPHLAGDGDALDAGGRADLVGSPDLGPLVRRRRQCRPRRQPAQRGAAQEQGGARRSTAAQSRGAQPSREAGSGLANSHGRLRSSSAPGGLLLASASGSESRPRPTAARPLGVPSGPPVPLLTNTGRPRVRLLPPVVGGGRPVGIRVDAVDRRRIIGVIGMMRSALIPRRACLRAGSARRAAHQPAGGLPRRARGCSAWSRVSGAIAEVISALLGEERYA